MNFKKYRYGSRELVLFVDESGDPTMRDPSNPLFVLGGCAALGENIQTTIRQPWLATRKALTGSENTPVHMRELRRISDKKMDVALKFFAESDARRISVAITDRTVFDAAGVPNPPVLELAFTTMLKLSEKLLVTEHPIEAISIVFEDGPLIEQLETVWKDQALTRSDGVLLPVSWGVLTKGDNEPGLEIADFVSHSAAGFIRSGRAPDSKFARRYLAVHPIDRPQLSRGWEMNKFELLNQNDQPS